jgi:hypothetical protein
MLLLFVELQRSYTKLDLIATSRFNVTKTLF